MIVLILKISDSWDGFEFVFGVGFCDAVAICPI